MEYLVDFLNNFFLSQDSSSGFLGGGTAETILKSAALGIAVMGVYFILSAFIPVTLHTRRTKNTVGVNKLMFFLHGMVGFFFFIGAVALIVAGAKEAIADRSKSDAPLTGVVFAICNGFGMSGSFYILKMKCKHEKAAKALGISEYAYYNEYIAKGRE